MKKVLCLVLVMSCILALCACKPKSELSKYITNYNEVTEALEDCFSHPKITNEGSSSEVQEFGKGYWALYVNDIKVTVHVYNHVAISFEYYDGSHKQYAYLPGGDRLMEQIMYDARGAKLVINEGVIQEVIDTPLSQFGDAIYHEGDTTLRFYYQEGIYVLDNLANEPNITNPELPAVVS